MAITVEVDAVDRSKLIDREARITWERDVNGQGQARFTLADVPGGFVPDDGMVAIIKEGATTRFEGLVMRRPRQFKGPDSATQLTFYDIAVGDYALITNKRRVWRAYVDVLFEDIVTDLNADFLTDEGVGLDVTAGTVQTVTFNGESVSECLDILCELEADGRTWRFEAGKTLTIETLAETAAPVVLDTDTLELNPEPTIEPDRSVYANVVTVIGGSEEFPISYTAEDAGEIAARIAVEGGSGIYHYTEEWPDAKTAGEVISAAEGILEKRKVLRQRFIGTTRTAGFEAGQSVTVNLPHLGLNAVGMFIESVATQTNLSGQEFLHTVTAITGDPDGGWQSFWKREKRQPKTISMQVEPDAGLIRIEPLPGPIVHDPPPALTEWFQAARSGAFFKTPSAIGIDHHASHMLALRRGGAANTGGCGGGLFPGARDIGCFANRQTILEKYPIDSETKAVGTVPISGGSWDEFAANAQFKQSMCVKGGAQWSALDQTVAVVQYGAPGTLVIVNLFAGATKSGSCASNLSAQANGGEPVWVNSGYIFWPNVVDGKIYIYDARNETAPTEVGFFLTSLTDVHTILKNSTEDFLYCIGTGGIVTLNLDDPEAPGPAATSGALTIAVNEPAGTFKRSAGNFETDGFAAGQVILTTNFTAGGNNDYWIIDTVVTDTITVVDSTGMVTEGGTGDEEIDAIEDGKLAPTGSYISGALSEDDSQLVCGVRVDGNNVRIPTIDVAGGALTLDTENIVSLVTAALDGSGAMISADTFICWSKVNAVDGANSLKAEVFDITHPDDVTHIETLSYTHGGPNLGPQLSRFRRQSVFTFGFNADAQITFGELQYDKVVPLTVDYPAGRAAFGATGHGGPGDEFLKGDIVQASATNVLERLAVGPDGTAFVANAAEVTNSKWGTPDDIFVERIDDPTYHSIQDFINQAWSGGRISGLALSDGGGATVDIAAGTGFIADADDPNARNVLFFDYAGDTTDAIGAGVTKWVYLDYNGGEPTWSLEASDDIDEHDKFLLGWATNEGGTMHVVNAPEHAANFPSMAEHTLREINGFTRADWLGGIILGESGDNNRNISLTEGEIYFGLSEFDISAVDTAAAGTFTRYYRIAGVWNSQAALTQWPIDTYTDGSDLQAMGNNRYGVLWWYVDVEDNELIVLYGTSNEVLETLAEAEAPPASPPERVARGAVLVGRYIIQEGETIPELIQSAFDVAFNPAGISDHNQLANLTTGAVHTEYALLAGRSGGQVLNLGLDDSDGGEIHSTAHGNKGTINLGDTLYVDEDTGDIGIGVAVPASAAGIGRFLHIAGAIAGIVLEDTDSNESYEMWMNGGLFHLWSEVLGRDTITIDRAGNVGIACDAGTLLEMQGIAPYHTLRNTTEEDGDGGRESRIIFEGEQSGGELSTLAMIQASHDGVADDEKGNLIFYTNDGNDGAAPTERMWLDSGGNLVLVNAQYIAWPTFAGSLKQIIRLDASDVFRILAPGVALFDANTRFSLRRIGGGAYSVTTLHIWDAGGVEAMRLDDNQNLMLGYTSRGANAVQTFGIETGTAPTSSPADIFQLYSKDWNGAGTAAPHFRTEEGDIIILANQGALTAEDATVIDATYGAVEEAVLNNVRTRIGELEAAAQAMGWLD